MIEIKNKRQEKPIATLRARMKWMCVTFLKNSMVLSLIFRHCEAAIAAVAIQTLKITAPSGLTGLLRRFAPRNDGGLNPNR